MKAALAFKDTNRSILSALRQLLISLDVLPALAATTVDIMLMSLLQCTSLNQAQLQLHSLPSAASGV